MTHPDDVPLVVGDEYDLRRRNSGDGRTVTPTSILTISFPWTGSTWARSLGRPLRSSSGSRTVTMTCTTGVTDERR